MLLSCILTLYYFKKNNKLDTSVHSSESDAEPELSMKEYWLRFLNDAGIEEALCEEYANSFVENEMGPDLMRELTHGVLIMLGIYLSLSLNNNMGYEHIINHTYMLVL